MKATINELWETGREVISYDNSEFERPQSIADLKKCENVLVGEKIKEYGMWEVLIENRIYMCKPTRVRGPYFDFYGIEVL